MKNMPAKPQLPIGIYRHYKGGVYQIVTLACHTETLEWYVVYESQKGKKDGVPSVWVRPYDMFIEEIVVDGKKVKRFERMSGEKF